MDTPYERGPKAPGAIPLAVGVPGEKSDAPRVARPIARPVAARAATAALCLLCLSGLLGASGCARLVVQSNPEGADVLWSPDGLTPWRPWPPLHWMEYNTEPGDDVTTVATPLAQKGPHADYVFVTVRKPGFYPPRPRLVGMSLFKTRRLHFDLAETPEHYAERQREAGLVPYQGQWVDPGKEGLVEYEGEWIPEVERTRRRMTAQGLIEFEGKWIKPHEYNVLYASRQRSKGLVEFKDRWVPPAIQKAEEAIDAAVAAIERVNPPEMFPPKVLGRGEGTLAGLGLSSGADVPTRWLLSGPASRWIDLPARGQVDPESLRLLPGRYTVTIFMLPSETKAAGAATGRETDSSLDEDATRQAGRSALAAQPLPSAPGAFRPPPSPLLPEKIDALKGLAILLDQPLSSGFQYSLSYTPPGTTE